MSSATTQSSNPSVIRNFLRSELKLLPGKFFDRPAPAHILNKFLVRLFETTGDAHETLRLLNKGIADSSQIERFVEESSDPAVRDDFARSISALFNSDRRAFRTVASFFPLDLSVTGNDPSDDNYGSSLVDFLSVQQKDILRTQLTLLLDSRTSSDAVSEAVASLTEKFDISEPSLVSNVSELLTDSVSSESLFANMVFEIISTRLGTSSAELRSAERIRIIHHLSTMLAGLTALGLLVDPISRNMNNKEYRLDTAVHLGEILGIVVYTGPPPGPSRDVCVRLSQGTLMDAVNRSYRAIEKTFTVLLGGDEWGGDSDWIEDLLVSRGVSGNDALEFKRICEPFMLEGAPIDAFRSVVTPNLIKSAVKSLASKVGLAGPQRGTGETRIFLETSFLESLVFFLGQDGMPFEKFVDTCYERLGLIIGYPSSISQPVLNRLAQIAGRTVDLDDSLFVVSSMMRRRLVATGLAQEFSDGFTVLRLQ
jgi:hypothetical protein